MVSSKTAQMLHTAFNFMLKSSFN